MPDTAWKIVRDDYADPFDGRTRFLPGTTVRGGEYGLAVHLRPATALDPVVRSEWPLRLVRLAADTADVVDRTSSTVCLRAATVVGEEDLSAALGPNGAAVLTQLERLRRVAWFGSLGAVDDRGPAGAALARHLVRLGLAVPALRWLAASDLDSLSAGWGWESDWLAACEALRQRLRSAALAGDRLPEFNAAADWAAEIVATPSREAVEDRLASAEQRQAASGAAIYAAGLAASWTVVADLPRPTDDPFEPLVEVFELGRWPLGHVREVFVLA